MDQARFDLNDLYERGPERRIELIDGQVIVGGSLAGSLALLGYLLESWGVGAAIALVDNVRLVAAALDNVQSTANDDFNIPVFEQRSWLAVSNLRQNITMGLFGVAANLEVYGRDIVMRLGENAATPDAFVFRRDYRPMTEYYLDGAAEIVAEFLPLPGTAERLELYRRGGVKECWLFDTQAQTLTVLELTNGDWQTRFHDSTGMYSSAAIRGISVRLPDVWANDNDRAAVQCQDESSEASASNKIPNETGVRWGTLAFAPRIELEPIAISFDEFISWAPESKFESYDGRLVIGSDEGSRNLIAMLLMTLGLNEAVKLFPAQMWRAAIADRAEEIARDDETRRLMLDKASRAAEIIKEHFAAERVALYGDYLSDKPTSFWSRARLVYWSSEDRFEQWHKVYEQIKNECGEQIEFAEFESLSESEQRALLEKSLSL